MLVRLTKNLDCYVSHGREVLEVAPGYVSGTLIKLSPKKVKKRVDVGGVDRYRPRRRWVVQFRLASGSGKLFALVSDIEGAYKKVHHPERWK